MSARALGCRVRLVVEVVQQARQPRSRQTSTSAREVRRSLRRPAFRDFRSSAYGPIEARYEQQYGLPSGLLSRIRTRGERSHADQVSEDGARTVYQFIPETRAGFIRNYGIDPWSSPEAAAQAAAIHLRDDYRRTGSWDQAVIRYHGGGDPSQWGRRTRSYARRVGRVDAP